MPRHCPQAPQSQLLPIHSSHPRPRDASQMRPDTSRSEASCILAAVTGQDGIVAAYYPRSSAPANDFPDRRAPAPKPPITQPLATQREVQRRVLPSAERTSKLHGFKLILAVSNPRFAVGRVPVSITGRDGVVASHHPHSRGQLDDSSESTYQHEAHRYGQYHLHVPSEDISEHPVTLSKVCAYCLYHVQSPYSSP